MEHELDRWFFIIHRCRHAFLREKFGRLDVEVRLLPFVLFLSEHQGVRQEDLSSYTGLDKPTVAHAVKRLVHLGYVVRERNPEDRRSYRLALSQQGKRLLPRVRSAMQQWNEAVLASLTDDERQTLEVLLGRLARAAGELTGREANGVTS